MLIQDVSGIPGESNYVIDLDNEVGSTNTKADGSGGYYGNNMLTRLRVFYGTENVTNQATVTVSADSGIKYTRTNNAEYVQVQVTDFTGSNMTGSVIFNVSSQGGAFPLSRRYSRSTGFLKVNVDRRVIPYRFNSPLTGRPGGITRSWRETST